LKEKDFVLFIFMSLFYPLLLRIEYLKHDSLVKFKRLNS